MPNLEVKVMSDHQHFFAIKAIDPGEMVPNFFSLGHMAHAFLNGITLGLFNSYSIFCWALVNQR